MSIQRTGNGVATHTSPEDWLAQGGLQEIAAEIVRTANITKRVVTLVEALTRRVEQLELPQVSPEVAEPQPEDFDLDLSEDSVEQQAEQLVEEPAEQLVEEPAEQLVEEPAEQPHVEVTPAPVEVTRAPVEVARSPVEATTDMLRVSIPQPMLLEALKIVCKALPRSSANPRLTDVKLVIGEREITVSATDGELWIEQTIPALTKGQGELLVVGRLLLETIKILPKDDLILDFHDNALHIEKGGANCSVSAVSVEDYPCLPRFDDALLTTMSCATLKRLLEMTTFAAVKQSSTGAVHYTNGVLIHHEGTRVDFVATDGHRLVLHRHDRDDSTEVESTLLIPVSVASILQQHLPDDGNLAVTIYELREKVFFEIPSYSTGKRVRTHHPATLIACDLVDVKFPPYERVIPKSFEARVYLSKDELVSALKRAILTCRQKGDNPVAYFESSDGVMQITAQGGEAGNATDRINCEGGLMKIALNPEYLMDVLKVISGDQVIIKWQSEVAPVAVTTPRNPDFIYIMMPIRMD